MLINVVFPDPEAPLIPTHVPKDKFRLIFFKMYFFFVVLIFEKNIFKT